MSRKFIEYPIADVTLFKKKFLNYASRYSRCCILDSNQYSKSNPAYRTKEQVLSAGRYELLAALGSANEILPSKKIFKELYSFYLDKQDFLFGFLSYLSPPGHPTGQAPPFQMERSPKATRYGEGNGRGGFPLMHFFQPKFVFLIPSNRECSVHIGFIPQLSSEEEVKNIFEEISRSQKPEARSRKPLVIIQRIKQKEYLDAIVQIKKHIQRGDIYEMNYCVEFFSENAEINPEDVFLKLNEISQTPFSAFYRLNDNYLLCASPERFLKKQGGKIISQPIKGTAPRGKTLFEDMEMKEELLQSEKEKSENVMIVDLVRNDLSRTCTDVRVEELFGVYAFRQWHQMISTISGEMRPGVCFTDVIQHAFPMGSMTGAPKIRAMELIQQYEKEKRGLYSGTVGYITPPALPPPPLQRRGEKGCWGKNDEPDFDFNVVIRSILYNASLKYLSFHVGSAITAKSIPEKEYEECLLKAKGMFEALDAGGKNPKSQKTNPKQYQNSKMEIQNFLV